MTPPQLPDKRCPRTGKRVFRTRLKAVRYSAFQIQFGIRLRPYHCRFCDKWHLTSQQPRTEPIEELDEPMGAVEVEDVSE